MQRTIVQVAKIRFMDLQVGDVMNRDPDAADGWFLVDELRRLPNGDLNATSGASRSSAMGKDYDIVGVQVTKAVEVGAPRPPG